MKTREIGTDAEGDRVTTEMLMADLVGGFPLPRIDPRRMLGEFPLSVMETLLKDPRSNAVPCQRVAYEPTKESHHEQKG